MHGITGYLFLSSFRFCREAPTRYLQLCREAFTGKLFYVFGQCSNNQFFSGCRYVQFAGHTPSAQNEVLRADSVEDPLSVDNMLWTNTVLASGKPHSMTAFHSDVFM